MQDALWMWGPECRMPWYAMSGGQHTPYTTYFQDTCACDVTHDQSRSSGPLCYYLKLSH